MAMQPDEPEADLQKFADAASVVDDTCEDDEYLGPAVALLLNRVYAMGAHANCKSETLTMRTQATILSTEPAESNDEDMLVVVPDVFKTLQDDESASGLGQFKSASREIEGACEYSDDLADHLACLLNRAYAMGTCAFA